MSSSVILTLFSVGAAVLIVAGITTALLVYACRQRQLEHLERMRALDMGQPLDPAQATSPSERQRANMFWIAFWIGGAVPLAAILGAGSSSGNTSTPTPMLVWAIAGAITGFGVLGAATIMCRAARLMSEERNERWPGPAKKPPIQKEMVS